MEEESKILLTKPYFSSAKEDSADNYRPPNLLRRIVSALQNIRVGSDLTSVQIPSQFNIPKSNLQIFGEQFYGGSSEMLNKCNRGKCSVERFVAVVGWALSTLHKLQFGTAPFNSILGETHHVSRGSLNILLEQVSHHPPVSAMHATDEKQNLELLLCVKPHAKFCGTSIRIESNGKKKLKLLNHNETYEISFIKLVIKLFPLPGTEWSGNLKIRCQESDLEADLSLDRSSFLHLKTNPTVKGKIFNSTSSKPLFKIEGRSELFTVTNLDTDETKVLYNGEEFTSRLKTPVVIDAKNIWASEAALVWGEVGKRILMKDWRKASEIKKGIEERQRELVRERKSREEIWKPKHFVVNNREDNGWDCSPIQKLVPPAPIAMPE